MCFRAFKSNLQLYLSLTLRSNVTRNSLLQFSYRLQNVTRSPHYLSCSKTPGSRHTTLSSSLSRLPHLPQSPYRRSHNRATFPSSALFLLIPPFLSLMLLLHPSSLLQGLETLIDDQNTSDIQILVTEYDSPALVESSGHPTPPRYRKRLLFAHSAILKSRSEYFCAMLGNDEQDGWAESGRGENRKLGLIKIEDFDFNCVYWVRLCLFPGTLTLLLICYLHPLLSIP